jgi:hypothetical protein
MNKGFFTFKKASAVIRTFIRFEGLKIAQRNSSFLCKSTLKTGVKKHYFCMDYCSVPIVVQQPFSLFNHSNGDE